MQSQQDKKRIFIAALDWGLGHATRIIPIIDFLEKSGIEVIIGASGACADLLRKEFPNKKIIRIPGYNIRYSRIPLFFKWSILIRLPRIGWVMRKERLILDKIIEKYKIAAVISDNRPGLFSKKIPSVYITHQLSIETGSSWMSKLATRWHQKMIQHFQTCWVPDLPEKGGLAGNLSHPKKLTGRSVVYIGPLSRMQPLPSSSRFDLLLLVSGPEPSRSIFEEKILEQVKGSRLKIALVRGLPGKSGIKIQAEGLEVFHHLPAADLNRIICDSDMILCRCGYSTVMDLNSLAKKAILVPTPGQTEQIYLAEHLRRSEIFYTVSEKKLNIKKDMKAAAGFNNQWLQNTNLHESAIHQWLTENQLI
jgi:predicted glycosyltransferase